MKWSRIQMSIEKILLHIGIIRLRLSFLEKHFPRLLHYTILPTFRRRKRKLHNNFHFWNNHPDWARFSAFNKGQNSAMKSYQIGNQTAGKNISSAIVTKRQREHARLRFFCHRGKFAQHENLSNNMCRKFSSENYSVSKLTKYTLSIRNRRKKSSLFLFLSFLPLP